MYYDKSSFPIILYKLKNDNISLDKILETYNFILSQKDFEKQFLDNINKKEKQDLFGYLVTVLPSIIFSDLRKFKRNEIAESKLTNQAYLFDLINVRLDLNKIQSKLHELRASNYVKNIDVDNIILDLNLFIHKYVFVTLSQIITSTSIKGNEYFFNIKKDSAKFNKFLNCKKDSGIDRLVSQKNFIIGYLESFGTNNLEKIKEIEDDLIYLSNSINQKKTLKLIFDNNIIFSESLTNTKKNDLMLYFFKNVIAKIFYIHLNDNSNDDYEVKLAFKNFRKRL